MTPELYAQAPGNADGARVRGRWKIMVTTFLDAKAAPKNTLKVLYRRRWNVELDLRNIKITLGIAWLRCIAPAMVVQELWGDLLVEYSPKVEGSALVNSLKGVPSRLLRQ